MFRCIAFTMLLRSDHFKWLIIPEHGKNDVTDFMHYSSDSNVFLFAPAFFGVVIMDDWIYGHFCPIVHLKVIKGYHMQDPPCKAGSALGHMDFVAIKFTGLLYGRVKAEVGIKLLWGGKEVKVTHFRDQYNGT